MWAIIKAILVYILCRILFGFVGFAFVAMTGVRQEGSMVQMAMTLDHWSFWVSLVIALWVLIKSW